jgi:hypothetical protein
MMQGSQHELKDKENDGKKKDSQNGKLEAMISIPSWFLDLQASRLKDLVICKF